MRISLSRPTKELLTMLIMLSGPVVGRAQAKSEETFVPKLPSVERGVSAELAAYRHSRVQDIVYDLHFTIPAKKEDAVHTTERIAFRLTDHDAPLQLDFKKGTAALDSVEVNGNSLLLEYREEHILIPLSYLKRGVNHVSLRYTATGQPLNRNNEYLYTLLVPDRARSLFPCFDQPDRKAVFNLTLSLPAGWKAVANAALKDSSASADMVTFHYLPSDTISTYLFAFAAGRFTETDGAPDGRPMHFYYRETDSCKLRLSLEPVFRIQADALAFLQQYTGIHYPFQKFDFVAIPDFQFGGMEHPGAIQYKASTLFLDEGATREQFLGRSNVLSHETAHMWFGDLVTMAWFNDVWMKEVFANFMADKIAAITLPDDKSDLKFLTAHFPAAYSIDRTSGAHPIRQQLDNLQEAGSLYGNIIYHKAPVMMRQLERLMGADAFRDGLRDYLKKYAFGNASWTDLIGILGRHTSADLVAWNRVWVNEAGRPRLAYKLRVEGPKITRLSVRQEGEDGSTRIWPQLFKISLVYKDHSEELPVHMNAPIVSIAAAKGKTTPLYILFNTDGQGYGVFPVDKASLAHIAENKSSLTRASSYINLYENMLDGNVISPRSLLALDRSWLSKEHEELNLNILVDQVSSVYWRFLPAASRDSVEEGLEKDLWEDMLADSAPNNKKILFKAFTNIVLSRTGQDRLYGIWQTQKAPAGVVLTEEDYTALSAALALRTHPQTESILAEQGQRIRNKDRKDRFDYLLPALSGDPAKRDSFFATLERPEGRKKESWVLTGLSYLHHPLRTDASEKYLAETLRLLEEVQRTGDVFFPQSWLQTSLAWYRSPGAAAVVHTFLSTHPGYNPKLKAKILQAADNLFRASDVK